MKVNEHLWTRWLEFSAILPKKQADVSTLIVEFAIPPWRDMYGKNQRY